MEQNNELEPKKEAKNIPTLPELIKAAESMEILEKEAISKQLVNKNPPDNWVKDHPMAKNVKYLPIDKVEFLMNNIFLRWWVEVKEVQLIANSVVTTVRVHYYDQTTKEWSCQDGIGACPLQTDKGSGASDWNAIKNDAVMKGAPASESYAIKDACEKIGRIFGSDLNRNDVMGYNLIEKFTGDKYKNLEK